MVVEDIRGRGAENIILTSLLRLVQKYVPTAIRFTLLVYIHLHKMNICTGTFKNTQFREFPR